MMVFFLENPIENPIAIPSLTIINHHYPMIIIHVHMMEIPIDEITIIITISWDLITMKSL